jgi:hypothetical protein
MNSSLIVLMPELGAQRLCLLYLGILLHISTCYYTMLPYLTKLVCYGAGLNEHIDVELVLLAADDATSILFHYVRQVLCCW